jgi:hypothetical protein
MMQFQPFAENIINNKNCTFLQKYVEIRILYFVKSFDICAIKIGIKTYID